MKPQLITNPSASNAFIERYRDQVVGMLHGVDRLRLRGTLRQLYGPRVMKISHYASATAFRRALEDRLQQWSEAETVDVQRLRRQVAFDRLLAHLLRAENPPWLLKGG